MREAKWGCGKKSANPLLIDFFSQITNKYFYCTIFIDESGGKNMKWKIEKDDTSFTAMERRRKLRVFKQNFALFMLALPGLVFLIIFKYFPMGGLVIAFKDYVPRKGLFGSKWVGLENFEFFFSSQDAFRTIRNTVLYSVDFLIVDLIVGVVIALMLYSLRNGIALKVYHTIILIPRFLSIVIVAFIAYSMLSPTYGVVNQIITAFGGEAINWYSEAEYWPAILNIVHIWQIAGSGCLYYYAALVGIDESLFEAAAIDGANTFQKYWHIAIPSLIPIMTLTTILGIGHIFSGDMGLFYQVTKNQGALYSTTDIINTYTYRALLDGSLEKSAAVGLFQSVTGLILVLITNGIVRKVSPENSMF